LHYTRIARMKSTGNIRGCDVRHDGFIIASTFAEVTVQIYFHNKIPHGAQTFGCIYTAD
jgi:hypothetical protein